MLASALWSPDCRPAAGTVEVFACCLSWTAVCHLSKSSFNQMRQHAGLLINQGGQPRQASKIHGQHLKRPVSTCRRTKYRDDRCCLPQYLCRGLTIVSEPTPPHTSAVLQLTCCSGCSACSRQGRCRSLQYDRAMRTTFVQGSQQI